ncbi:MAG: sigma-54-dependent transcriptional regulator [Deltaproteobacteria bacterium]
MRQFSIFIVEDEETTRDGIAVLLGNRYRVKAFPDAESAIEAVQTETPDLVLLDIGLPGMCGLDALRVIKAKCPSTDFIMITAFEDIPTVVSAMKGGASDYVVKPLQMEALEVNIRNVLDAKRVKTDIQSLQAQYLKENLPCIVGESDAIQEVMEFVEAVAGSPDTPVLILGETGTGKELVAGAIHYRSPRSRGPLVSVNCAAIPEELIESELFGYQKGAFSGASASGKKGLVEEADGGTLFLDEVGDLSLDAQAKLLRFLEEGEFYRVGGTKKFKVDVRVVSVTNKDLKSLIGKGMFREDLYYRLAVVKVAVPSLNDRREDIVPIARHFLDEFSRKFRKPFSGFAPEAESALTSYNWNGNVRELKNVIERSVLIGRGPLLSLHELGLKDADGAGSGISSDTGLSCPPLTREGLDLDAIWESMEGHYIEEALRMTGGNESAAALLLNLNHQTFRYRRRKLEK